MIIIDDTSAHQLAEWRRKGHGVWYLAFVVEGYNEDFVMRLPGNLSEGFALATARMQLAKALKVHGKHVFHKSTAKEA